MMFHQQKTIIMKKIFLFFSMLLAMGLSSACSNETEGEDDLSNTSWRLLGFCSMDSNELQSIQPENCDNCYVLTFSTDGIFSGRTASNKFEGAYSAEKGLFAILKCTTTKVGDIYDNDRFYTALLNSTHYSISDSQLKLFYNNKQNYLIFVQK